MRSQPPLPYFMPTDPRPLNEREQAVIERLLKELSSRYAEQLGGLQVVGRCGCGACPTVFFQAHEAGDRETDLVNMIGRDSSGGLVAAVLLEKAGTISQLEFYSVDGHDPWETPDAESLVPW